MSMSGVPCRVEGCEKTAKARGWCPAHYGRWRVHGNPLGAAPKPPACGVEGCERKHKAYGWCKPHYRRWKKYGHPLAGPPARGNGTSDGLCSIERCERPHEAKGWCAPHYTRWRERGDPRADEPIRPPAPEVCEVDGCEQPTHARGWCAKHYARWMDNGDVHKVSYIPGSGDDILYGAAHHRIYRERGKASAFTCPCGDQAQEWAYNYDCPRERTQLMTDGRSGKARLIPYSPDPWAYDALCLPCHHARDKAYGGRAHEGRSAS